jgi:hypothetical protein
LAPQRFSGDGRPMTWSSTLAACIETLHH